MLHIKFRQPTFIQGKFDGFHYWGFIDDVFYGPLTGRHLSASQQFTGLLDKNGKEIYEGDIVYLLEKFQNWHSYREGRIIVKESSGWIWTYNNKTIKHQIIWSEKDAGFTLSKETTSTGRMLSMKGKSYLVIGNIYENPELLTI